MANTGVRSLLPKRFTEKINFTDTCWIWIASKRKDGYGQYSIGSRSENNRKTVGAHRFCWECIHGVIPDDLQVLHKCDVPACVNPDHLFLGTNKDNIIDRTVKGRSARGEKNGNSKLNQFKVNEIRKQYKRGVVGEFSLSGMAKKYNVTKKMIGFIVNNKNWIRREG